MFVEFNRSARRSLVLLICALGASLTAQAAEFVGIVYPGRDATLSVQAAGVVSRVVVQVGQRVRAGQSILEVDARAQQLEVDRREIILNDQAELDSTQQRAVILEQLVRDASLLYEAAGTVSREELMKLRLELEATRGRMAQLRESKRREETEVRLAHQDRRMRVLAAPSSGVITAIQVHPGEWVAPGDPVVRLVDDAWCELRVNVSLAAARSLVVGQQIAVLVDDPAVGLPVSGRVSFVSPVIDAGSSLVEVRIRIPNEDRRIRPGVKARLRLEGTL